MTDYEAVAREWMVANTEYALSGGSNALESLAALIRREVEAAVNAERAACSDIIERAPDLSADGEGQWLVMQECARQIRARGSRGAE